MAQNRIFGYMWDGIFEKRRQTCKGDNRQKPPEMNSAQISDVLAFWLSPKRQSPNYSGVGAETRAHSNPGIITANGYAARKQGKKPVFQGIARRQIALCNITLSKVQYG